MKSKAAATGPGAMVLVANEQAFSQDRRIVRDELAYQLLPIKARANVWLLRHLSGSVLQELARLTTMTNP
jgi:hypothetical protein